MPPEEEELQQSQPPHEETDGPNLLAPQAGHSQADDPDLQELLMHGPAMQQLGVSQGVHAGSEVTPEDATDLAVKAVASKDRPNSMKSSSDGKNPTDVDASDSERVRSYLMDKYGLGNGDDDLKKAQAYRAQNQGQVGLAEGLATIGAAASGSDRVKVPTDFYNRLNAQGSLPIQNLLEQRQMKEQGLKNEGQIDSLVAEKEQADPNSSTSQQVRKVYSGVLAQAGMPKDMIDGASASDVKNFLQSPVETMAKLNEALQSRKLQQQQMAMYKQQAFGAGQAKQMDADPEYKDARTALNQSQSALQSLDVARTNPAAAALIPIEVVRGLIKGRINSQELQAAAGGQDLESYYSRLLQKKAQGTITDKDYEGFRQIFQIAAARAQQQMDGAVHKHASRMASLSGGDEDAAAQFLTGGPQNPASQAALSQAAPAATVKVKLPDGRTGTIPGDKLQDALKHGAVQVQ